MADMFPDEGLDLILAVIPKNGTPPANMYAGIFTSSNGTSSVPAASATIPSMGTGYAECATGEWTTYARQTQAATAWGSPAAKTIWSVSGRGVDASAQLSFPAPSVAYNPANPMQGFFLANGSTAGAGTAYYYSNWNDMAGIASLGIGDVVKVTPTFGWGY